MATYQLSILTPHGEIFNGPIEALSAQGQLGNFGVLPGHSPIIYALKKGVLRISVNGSEKLFSHEMGILEVKPDHNVLVLVDEVVMVDGPNKVKLK